MAKNSKTWKERPLEAGDDVAAAHAHGVLCRWALMELMVGVHFEAFGKQFRDRSNGFHMNTIPNMGPQVFAAYFGKAGTGSQVRPDKLVYLVAYLVVWPIHSS